MNSTKYLTDAERLGLETYLREKLDTDTRNAAMLLVALHSGARANELLALTWQDFDLETGATFIRTLKGGLPREVVLPRFVVRALVQLKVQSPLKPFDLSYNRLGEIWREYRPTPKPFHSLRHTFAMRVYEKTKDIRFTQRALGHRSITNTMVYADCAYTAIQFKKMMGVR
jgi:integrase/recombinase XerC